METVLIAKDGRPIDVEIHATALFDQERGGLVHSRAFVRDVTERHRLEQELQHYTTGLEQAVSERTQELVASQARYKALFDLVADSVFMVNAAGTVVAVNKREEQALGYAESKVVGRSMHDVVVPSHREALTRWLAEIGTGQRQVPTQEITVPQCGGIGNARRNGSDPRCRSRSSVGDGADARHHRPEEARTTAANLSRRTRSQSSGTDQGNRRNETISGKSARERQRRDLYARYRTTVYLRQQQGECVGVPEG